MKANNQYYEQEQIIPEVDRDGKIIGQVEKWEAHKKGILHRGFSIALIYKGKYILQHRRHPAFDGTYDLTTSSHQLLVNGKFETLKNAAISALQREWKNIELIGEPKNLGTVYYKAKDPKSEFTEHEVCDVLIVEVENEPIPNPEFAYGSILATKEELEDKNSEIYEKLSPWSKEVVNEGLV
jgi:isopentenyl-diphosphate delta-isomerase